MAKSDNNHRAHILDDVDYILLSALQENCRISSVELSRTLQKKGIRLGAGSVGTRVKDLIKHGYIKKSPAILDPEKFGLTYMCLMLVKMHQRDDESLHKFVCHARADKSVLEFYELQGGFDYLLKVRVANVKQSTEISKRLGQGVADLQTCAVGEIHKEETAIALYSTHREPSDRNADVVRFPTMDLSAPSDGSRAGMTRKVTARPRATDEL